MKRFALTTALALATGLGAAAVASPALAQQVSPVPVVEAGHSVLSISAEGKSTRDPDLAVFSAGVTTQGKSAAEALAENSKAMTQVIASLKRGGIADRDIQTNNLSINPIYSNPERDAQLAAQSQGRAYVPLPPEQQIAKIIGYSVSNNVSVRQRKLGDYGKVIDTLVTAGANQVNGPAFQLDNSDAALDEARVAAVKTARQRATLYAGAAGLKVVRILSINESGGYYVQPQVAFVKAARDSAAAAPPVQAGELQLTANVTVLFELAP